MSARVDAMIWWRAMSANAKIVYTKLHFPGREPESLTGREIEIIYNAILERQ